MCFFSYPTYYERKVLGEGLFDDEESDDFSSLNLMPAAGGSRSFLEKGLPT